MSSMVYIYTHIKDLSRLLRGLSPVSPLPFFGYKDFKRVFSQMGRESNDSIVIQSSIALLQERFRQLQRVKEMREERELTRLLVEPKQFNPTLHYEPSRLYFHFLPPRSPPHVSLSLWPNSEGKHDDFQFKETPLLISLRPTETPTMHASPNKFENSDFDDVDTSLHL